MRIYRFEVQDHNFKNLLNDKDIYGDKIYLIEDSVVWNRDLMSMDTLNLSFRIANMDDWKEKLKNAYYILIYGPLTMGFDRRVIIDSIDYDEETDLFHLKAIDWTTEMSKFHWGNDYPSISPKIPKKGDVSKIGSMYLNPTHRTGEINQYSDFSGYEKAPIFYCLNGIKINDPATDIVEGKNFVKIDVKHQNFLPDTDVESIFKHIKDLYPRLNMNAGSESFRGKTDFMFEKGSVLDNYYRILTTFGGFKNNIGTAHGIKYIDPNKDPIYKYDDYEIVKSSIITDYSNLTNVFFPYGDYGLTIENSNPTKLRYIQDEDSIKRYGRLHGSKVYSGVMNSKRLLELAKEDLKANKEPVKRMNAEILVDINAKWNEGGHVLESGDILQHKGINYIVVSTTLNPTIDNINGRFPMTIQADTTIDYSNPLDKLLKKESVNKTDEIASMIDERIDKLDLPNPGDWGGSGGDDKDCTKVWIYYEDEEITNIGKHGDIIVVI